MPSRIGLVAICDVRWWRGRQQAAARTEARAALGHRSARVEAAALHHQAEVLDRPLDLLVGVLEQLGDQLRGLAARRVVAERDLDVGPAPTVVEADRAGVSTSASPTLRQAMRWLGTSSTISASHSTDLPSGPVTFQWLVVGPVTITSSTSGMNAGKFEKSRQ